MPNYLCLQRPLPSDGAPGGKPTPAEMQEMYAKFNAWRTKFHDKLVDAGGKLGKGRVATAGPAPDGPLVEELVGGYMILSAADLDEAVEIARECPGLVRPGSGVQVVEADEPAERRTRLGSLANPGVACRTTVGAPAG